MLVTNLKKITYVEALSTVLTNCEVAPEVRERLEALRVQLEKRNSAKAGGERKPTKTQTENAAIKEGVLVAMAENPEPKTVAELIAAGAFPEGTSSQKATALLTQLVRVGLVKREEVKGGKAVFSPVGE